MTAPAIREVLEGIVSYAHVAGCRCGGESPNEATTDPMCPRVRQEMADAILALVGEVERERWKCKASATADPPQDCDMPFCGCDPTFHAVMETLQESGWLPCEEADRLRAALAEQEGCLDRLAEIFHTVSEETRVAEVVEWERAAQCSRAEDDLYGWNFYEGMRAGANAADILYQRLGRAIDEGRATKQPAGQPDAPAAGGE